MIDPDEFGTPVLYWYEITTGPDNEPRFIRHLVGDKVGSGRQFATTDIDIFKQQQPVVDGEPISEHLVLPGDYAIDYETGRYAIKGYSGFSSTIHYAAIHREFKIRTNKVDLIQLHSEAAQDSLFNQVENNVYISEEERFTNGLPTDELFEILQTLLNTGSYLQYWGE